MSEERPHYRNEEGLDFDEILERVIRDKDQLPLGQSETEAVAGAALDNDFTGLVVAAYICSSLAAAIILRLPDEQRTPAHCEAYFRTAYKLMMERLGLSPDPEFPLDQMWLDSLREWFEDLEDFPNSN